MRAFRVISEYPLHVLTAALLGFTVWVGRDLTAAPAAPEPYELFTITAPPLEAPPPPTPAELDARTEPPAVALCPIE